MSTIMRDNHNASKRRLDRSGTELDPSTTQRSKRPKKEVKKELRWQEPLTTTQVALSGSSKRRKDTKVEHKHPPELWSSKRKRIKELFEEHSIVKVAEIMEKEGFHASISQYQHHLKQWGAWKYFKLSEKQLRYIRYNAIERARLGKFGSAIRLNGKKISFSQLVKVFHRVLDAAFKIEPGNYTRMGFAATSDGRTLKPVFERDETIRSETQSIFSLTCTCISSCDVTIYTSSSRIDPISEIGDPHQEMNKIYHMIQYLNFEEQMPSNQAQEYMLNKAVTAMPDYLVTSIYLTSALLSDSRPSLIAVNENLIVFENLEPIMSFLDTKLEPLLNLVEYSLLEVDGGFQGTKHHSLGLWDLLGGFSVFDQNSTVEISTLQLILRRNLLRSLKQLRILELEDYLNLAKQYLKEKQKCLKLIELREYQSQWTSCAVSGCIYRSASLGSLLTGYKNEEVPSLEMLDPEERDFHLALFRKKRTIPRIHSKDNTMIMACYMETSTVPGIQDSIKHGHIKRFEVKYPPLWDSDPSWSYSVSCGKCGCGCVVLQLREIELLADVSADYEIEECAIFDIVGTECTQGEFKIKPSSITGGTLNSIFSGDEDYGDLMHDCKHHEGDLCTGFDFCGSPKDETGHQEVDHTPTANIGFHNENTFDLFYDAKDSGENSMDMWENISAPLSCSCGGIHVDMEQFEMGLDEIEELLSRDNTQLPLDDTQLCLDDLLHKELWDGSSN